MSVPMIDTTLNPAMNNNTINNAIGTLQGLNQARQQYLNNQALQATVPYAGQQAQAQVGLTQGQANLANAQANFFPLTAKSGLLGAYSGIQRAQAAMDNSNLNYLKSAPGQALMAGKTPQSQAARQQFLDIMARQQSLASSGLMGGAGAMLGGTGNYASGINNSNLAPLVNTSSPVMSLINRLTGNSQPSPPQNVGSTGQMLSGNPFVSQPLPMTANPANVVSGGGAVPGQPIDNTGINRLGAIMNSGGGFSGVPGNAQPTTTQTSPTTADQIIQKVASNITAKNALVNPQLTNRYIQAESLAQTFKTINDNIGIPAITFAPYMGAKGAANLKADQVKQSAGIPVPLLEKYNAFQSMIPMNTGQITKFYGGSVAPQAEQELHIMQNPISWTNTPGSAIRAYNMYSEIVNNEGGNYADAVNKRDDFNKVAPQFNAANVYSQISKQPTYAADIINALTPTQKTQLKIYHDSLPRSANG